MPSYYDMKTLGRKRPSLAQYVEEVEEVTSDARMWDRQYTMHIVHCWPIWLLNGFLRQPFCDHLKFLWVALEEKNLLLLCSQFGDVWTIGVLPGFNLKTHVVCIEALKSIKCGQNIDMKWCIDGKQSWQWI